MRSLHRAFRFQFGQLLGSKTAQGAKDVGVVLAEGWRSAGGGNYPAITEPELEKILVPVPDAATQDFIATEVRHRREEARRLRAEAEAGWEGAKEWFEVQLLGDTNIS